MKKKILIIGGTGFIGFHLSKKCLKKKWEVHSISTKKPSKQRYLKDVKYILIDISKKRDLRKKIREKYDYVVNFGGHVDHSNKSKTYKSHFLGCKNLVEIFKNNQPKFFLQMGSSAEYGTNKSPLKENMLCAPSSIYGKSKLFATNYLIKTYKKNKFPVVIFRLFQTYGPNQDINRIIPITIDGCIKDKKFNCSSGVQTRDFVHIYDVIDAVFLAFKNKRSIGKIINIGSGKPRKIKKIIVFINKTVSKGTPLFGKIKMRKDEILENYADIKQAAKILRWKPKISFNEGLRNTIRSYVK